MWQMGSLSTCARVGAALPPGGDSVLSCESPSSVVLNCYTLRPLMCFTLADSRRESEPMDSRSSDMAARVVSP